MSDTSAGSNDEFTPPAACPPLPAVAAISSLTLPPFRASDYYRLVKQPLRSPPWRQRFNCLCTQLSTYGFHSEEEFTGDCSLLMSAMQCMPKEDGQGDGDEEDDDHSESEDSATNLGLSLPSCLASGMSIRTLSRGRTAPSFARGAIQRWVQRTYANGNSSLSGNNRPDLCVSMRYRDGYLLSLVGEDAIFGRSSKRAREGETLVYALPSRNTRSGAVRTARPYDEEFAKIWQYKFARIQLYLLSAFVTFGCRLGLLRIHDQYARFYVEDKNTVIVESSADFLSDQPSANAAAAAAGDVSAAAFVDNKENSRHVPHRWTNKTSCLKPMVDIIALAYETLLEVELSEPLPLLFGPERDEALPGVPSVTTTTRHGIELYPILQRDRTGQSPLVPEEQSAARFRDIFRGTDWTWDAAEPPPSPLTSELDYPDDDTDDSPDNPDNPDAGDPDDPNDRPDEVNRDESPTNDDPEDHHAAGQPDDPPADGAVSSEGGSRLRQSFVQALGVALYSHMQATSPQVVRHLPSRLVTRCTTCGQDVQWCRARQPEMAPLGRLTTPSQPAKRLGLRHARA